MKDSSSAIEATSPLPIHYDFENLGLQLNTSIASSDSDVFWKWDYMSSNNSYPDTLGVDFFMNHSQPYFSYNGEKTLPSLSIKTNKNRITEFSVTVIFNLVDDRTESIERLLDSLTTFDLLQDESVKQSIIEKGTYKSPSAEFEETIELTISEEEYGYDRMKYEIKNKEPHTR